jgi:hypothetical protein
MMILLLGSICLGPIGCSDDEPPEKTTIEKLNSDNQEEQEQGLDEANEKYGGGQ